VTRGLADERGTSAVEFAMIAPVFGLLLIGTIDFGAAIYDRFALNGAVSAAADYAIINASSVNSANGRSLAQSLGNILSSGPGADWANAAVTVNNGPSATLSGGVLTLGGSSSPADLCYCPTPASGGGVNWGSSMTCGSSCSGGGVAGKYVTLAASVRFTSMFGSSGLIPSQTFTTSSVVETQ
jgi:Flp pilus assembly protein TadG